MRLVGGRDDGSNTVGDSLVVLEGLVIAGNLVAVYRRLDTRGEGVRGGINGLVLLQACGRRMEASRRLGHRSAGYGDVSKYDRNRLAEAAYLAAGLLIVESLEIGGYEAEEWQSRSTEHFHVGMRARRKLRLGTASKLLTMALSCFNCFQEHSQAVNLRIARCLPCHVDSSRTSGFPMMPLLPPTVALRTLVRPTTAKPIPDAMAAASQAHWRLVAALREDAWLVLPWPVPPRASCLTLAHSSVLEVLT